MRQAVAVNYVDPSPEANIVPESRPEELSFPAPKRNQSEHTAKLIEFPRTIYTPQVWATDLAEPILDRPRILEAPEIVPPPPALGGMTIEEAEKPEPERRMGIDMPLQSAPIAQRVLASLVDGILVVAAGSVFGAIYYRIVGATPTPVQVAMMGSGLLILCWAAYSTCSWCIRDRRPACVHCGCRCGASTETLRIGNCVELVYCALCCQPFR
jgi:hypothetical protein